jgi:hypothetical protein
MLAKDINLLNMYHLARQEYVWQLPAGFLLPRNALKFASMACAVVSVVLAVFVWIM